MPKILDNDAFLPCPVCNKPFARTSRFKAHYKTVHKSIAIPMKPLILQVALVPR